MKKDFKKVVFDMETISKIGIFVSSLFVTASAVYLYSPILGSNAVDSSVDVNVDINPIISLSLDTNALNFSITPTSSGVFDSKPIVATVDTNSTGGYELYFSSIDDQTSMTSLTSESTITSTFANTVTSTTMANNTWGYSLDNTDFSKIPTLTNHVALKNIDHLPSAAEKTTTTNIGVKIDSTIASGTYNKKVLFSAIAHDSLPTPIQGLRYMQQMTAASCNATTTPLASATQFDWDGSHHGDKNYVPRTVLTDARDGKRYLISKLADGNCWMSQNLAFNLDSTVALTNENTDLNTKTSWTPENSTTDVPSDPWSSDYDDVESVATAARSNRPREGYEYYRGGDADYSTPTANTDEYLWESAGNYYNWYAATAGSGTYSTVSTSVEDSICPKGWKLPSYSGDKSFKTLIDTYTPANGEALLVAPLNFIRAGGRMPIHDNTSNMRDQGYLFTNTATSNEKRMYRFYYGSFNVLPQDDAQKSIGFSIRCVAR